MTPPPEHRPDPDLLLERVREDDARAVRGHLRIYFGACAGVGKTCAMLGAAQRELTSGRDVVVGVVETHGRHDTAVLLHGLPQLPPRRIDWQGNAFSEFDLPAALARAPQLILVDELAHSNVPGSRHPKRWQDVVELLDAGIDVWTTLNVQHLESLNDVVGGITGVRVRETLPDTLFDRADEVIVVDVPTGELLGRLKAGKVYLQEQADRAAQGFFRAGNLIALRELALRRAADRVEDEVQSWRQRESVTPAWKTDTSLLCCVGPGDAAHVIRSAARLASGLNAAWTAVFVETPALARRSEAQRARTLEHLALAQSLGADTRVLSGEDAAQAIVDHARGRNISRLVLGPARTGWRLGRGLDRRLVQIAPEFDIVRVGRGQDPPDAAPPAAQGRQAVRVRSPARYAWAVALCVLPLLAGIVLEPWFDAVNIAMLFLLTVLVAGMRLGRGPSALAALVAVAAFDFFFVPPRLSFAVADVQYLFTFAVMLACGLTAGQLAAHMRVQARAAFEREERSHALYELARDLSGPLRVEEVVEQAAGFISRLFHVRVAVVTPDEQGRLLLPAGGTMVMDAATAQWAFDQGRAAGAGTDTLPGAPLLYLPLRAPMRNRGVLAVEAKAPAMPFTPEELRQLDTCAALVAAALERVHYVEVAREATVRIETERLRNSLLAAVSHDLRTPLSALLGLIESLGMDTSRLLPQQRDLVHGMRETALGMQGLLTNLLDMARIESGEVAPRRQWHLPEEVVGSALRMMAVPLAGHRVETALAPDLPLVEFDAVLIERVLCNLLDNAVRHTPPGSRIRLAVEARDGALRVSVSDDGPGIPPGMERRIFDKFERGIRESATAGIGLGLAICRAIVEAHQGRIEAGNRPEGGAVFRFTLPLGTPPDAPESVAGGERELAP